MGIIINTISITIGAFLGGAFKEYIKLKNFTVLSISIMIISLVGFFENIYNINEMALQSNDLLVVVFALIIGTSLGDFLQLETRMSNISSLVKNNFSSLIDTAIFFGVGGMQICGPMLLVMTGDNSQLILKSIIDFPFAVMFGASYGKKVALSAMPVTIVQLFIAGLTMLSEKILDMSAIKQLCSMGYIILFFSGYNLVCKKGNKVNNVNMIIGIFIILVYNILLKLAGVNIK